MQHTDDYFTLLRTGGFRGDFGGTAVPLKWKQMCKFQLIKVEEEGNWKQK